MIMKYITKIVAALLLVALTFGLVACGEQTPDTPETPVNAQALLQSLLNTVPYDCEMTAVEENAELYFPNLPAAKVTMYIGDGFHADELAIIELTDAATAEQAVSSVKEHLQEVRAQFLSYNPDQVAKIDDAVVWNKGNCVVLCISANAAAAQALCDNPPTMAAPTPTDPVGSDDPTDPVDSGDPTDLPTEPPTQGPTEPEYITLTSKSGKYKTYNGVYLIDNMAYEGYNYSDSAASNYAALVSKVAQQLEGTTKVYDLVIPTAIGVVLPDDMKDKIQPEDQAQRLKDTSEIG